MEFLELKREVEKALRDAYDEAMTWRASDGGLTWAASDRLFELSLALQVIENAGTSADLWDMVNNYNLTIDTRKEK